MTTTYADGNPRFGLKHEQNVTWLK